MCPKVCTSLRQQVLAFAKSAASAVSGDSNRKGPEDLRSRAENFRFMLTSLLVRLVAL